MLDDLFNSVGVVVYTGVYVFVCCCDLFDLFNGCFGSLCWFVVVNCAWLCYDYVDWFVCV